MRYQGRVDAGRLVFIGEAHDQLAGEAAERALGAASTDSERALALSDRARVLHRLGKTDEGCELLRAALELDPHNSVACECCTDRCRTDHRARGAPSSPITCAESLPSWSFGFPPTRRDDYRDIELIAGVDPYAAKGVSDEALPFERSHDAASVAELFEAFAAEARARRPTRR
jgi:tetratricopeptide (TPR) repeat protein